MSDTTRTLNPCRRRWLAGLAAGAALAVALTACTPAQAGAAAVVDGRRITVDQVNSATQGIKAGNPQLAEGQGLDRTVLFFLVISPWVLRAAEDNGVGVSEAEGRQLLPKASSPDPNSVRVLRTFLALQKLQQAEKSAALAQVQKDVAAAKPDLNPRYGTFDLKEMAVVDAPPNWIVPNSEPTPTSTSAP